MAKRAPRGRYCTHSGYVYRYEDKRNWKRSSDERWETIVTKVRCGRLVGTRTIDGSHVKVITVGGRYYAALPHGISKSK